MRLLTNSLVAPFLFLYLANKVVGMNKKKIGLTLFLSIIFLIFIIISCTAFGLADISIVKTTKILGNKIFKIPFDLNDIKKSQKVIIWNLRFPRVILALLVGGALSLCGVAYQGIFKNPMADPFILGISSGAALGATIGIILNISNSLIGLNIISGLAFIFSLLTISIVYNISKVGRNVPVTTLLLSGIAMGQFLTAITSILMIFNAENLGHIIFWTLGSFSAKSWRHVMILFPYVSLGGIILYTYSRELDIMLLGEDTAIQLGVDIEKTKKVVLFITALITSAAVSITGIIGFIGLITPHIIRLILGPKHKKLFPFSFLLGGAFMVICDTIARSIINQEIPVGIITALFGGPFFIYLLRKKKREVA